jgi:hypothetical protein
MEETVVNHNSDPTRRVYAYPSSATRTSHRRRRRSRSARRRNLGIAALGGFAAAVALIEVGGRALQPATVVETAPFTLSGTIRLNADSVTTTDLPPGFMCAGAGEYGDIGPNAAVTVTNQSNTVLARGTLDRGSTELGSCLLTFSVEHVPAAATFYQVEVAHRGAYRYTEHEVRTPVLLALGNGLPQTLAPAAAPPVAPMPVIPLAETVPVTAGQTAP